MLQAPRLKAQTCRTACISIERSCSLCRAVQQYPYALGSFCFACGTVMGAFSSLARLQTFVRQASPHSSGTCSHRCFLRCDEAVHTLTRPSSLQKCWIVWWSGGSCKVTKYAHDALCSAGTRPLCKLAVVSCAVLLAWSRVSGIHCHAVWLPALQRHVCRTNPACEHPHLSHLLSSLSIGSFMIDA